jgi:hypothetical protein
VSSTARWRPIPCSRKSRASSNHRPRASASLASDWPNGCWKQGKDRACEHRATLYAFGRSLSRIIFRGWTSRPAPSLPHQAPNERRENTGISRRRHLEEPPALDSIRVRNSSTPAVRCAQRAAVRGRLGEWSKERKFGSS